MREDQVREYLKQILPDLADLADTCEAPDLGQIAFTLRLVAERAATRPGPALSLVH